LSFGGTRLGGAIRGQWRKSCEFCRLFLLTSLLASATALKCWHTGSTESVQQSTSLRNPAVPIIARTCPSSDVSCERTWWTVAEKSDYFYRLGCSSAAVATEKMTDLGKGEQSSTFCATDYCNSSSLTSPLVGLVLAMVALVASQ